MTRAPNQAAYSAGSLTTFRRASRALMGGAIADFFSGRTCASCASNEVYYACCGAPAADGLRADANDWSRASSVSGPACPHRKPKPFSLLDAVSLPADKVRHV